MLCDLISRSEPNFDPKMDATCDSSLERLGRLTQEMSSEIYTYFDLLLMVRHLVGPLSKARKLTIPLVRFRGKGRQSPSVHGSVSYRMEEVHPYDIVVKLLRGHRQTLKPTPQTHLSWCSAHCCGSPYANSTISTTFLYRMVIY